MEDIICRNCGSKTLIQKDGIMVCPYCDSRFVITKEDRYKDLISNGHYAVLSHSNVDSSIALDDDISKLLLKCKTDPQNAKKYANLILDIDPDNLDALCYL